MQIRSGQLLLSLALAVLTTLGDNLALESRPYLAHSSCHTQYDHVTVVKQGQQGWYGGILVLNTDQGWIITKVFGGFSVRFLAFRLYL